MLLNKIFPALVLGLTATACSPASNLSVKGVDLHTSQVGNATYLNMEAIVLMGNLKFPNVEVPIFNPKTLQPLGQMALQSLNDGTNRLTVSVDYEQATHLDPALGTTMPNQRELPLSLGIGKTTMVGIPVMEQSRIYVGGDSHSDLFIGAAISIPAFDTVLSQVPYPLNIFFNFPFSPQISSAAGLFSGPAKGQNGIAVFVKKSFLPSAPSMVQKLMSRTEATVQVQTIPAGGEEMHRLNTVTLIRLDRLLNRHGTLKVK